MASKNSISRRSFLKAVGAGSAAVAAAGVLTACGGSSSSTASSAASTAASAAPATTELAAEQVLNLIYTDLALIDVNDVRNSNEFEVLTAVQEGLFRTFTDENGVDVVENAGCESYDVSDDGLTYTFHLREGMVWSDDQPVTAQNYVDSWLRLVNPDLAFSYAFLAYGIVGAEDYCENGGKLEDVAVELVDDLTDSGQTLHAVTNMLRERHPAITELRTAVIWTKGVSSWRPDYAAEHLPTSPWIHQPFEQYDKLSLQDLQHRNAK